VPYQDGKANRRPILRHGRFALVIQHKSVSLEPMIRRIMIPGLRSVVTIFRFCPANSRNQATIRPRMPSRHHLVPLHHKKFRGADTDPRPASATTMSIPAHVSVIPNRYGPPPCSVRSSLGRHAGFRTSVEHTDVVTIIGANRPTAQIPGVRLKTEKAAPPAPK